MRLKAKAACGDDDTSPANTGLCSDFYVFKWVLTGVPSQPQTKHFHATLAKEALI
jgi:hypothetical protein